MKETNEKKASYPHAHHRERMFARAEREGFENFATHELLEVLLYYSKPRVNTNPTAHALLERYDTIKGVMDATADELCMVDGVGPRSAVLIRLITELARRYERDCFETSNSFQTLEKIAQYIHPSFIGLNFERLYVMYFNNRMNLIECRCHSEGTVNSTDVILSKISATALQKNAAAVVLAHNHPNGYSKPSQMDIDLNTEVRHHLGMLGIVLVEHLVFADKSYSAIMRDEGLYRISPITKRQDIGFYRKFYQNCPMEIPKVFEADLS